MEAPAEAKTDLEVALLIRRRGPWRSLDEVEYATLEWVHWYNTQRLLEPIGYVPPAEQEESYYRDRETTPVAA